MQNEKENAPLRKYLFIYMLIYFGAIVFTTIVNVFSNFEAGALSYIILFSPLLGIFILGSTFVSDNKRLPTKKEAKLISLWSAIITIILPYFLGILLILLGPIIFGTASVFNSGFLSNHGISLGIIVTWIVATLIIIVICYFLLKLFLSWTSKLKLAQISNQM